MPRLTLTFGSRDELEALYATQLGKGWVFLRGATGVEPLAACTLVLELDGARHEIPGEAVFVKAQEPGMGVGFQCAPSHDHEALHAFVKGTGGATRTSAPPSRHPSSPPEDSTLQERIRHLTPVAQAKLAATGSMPERLALERTFGPNVWEPLLGNPRITIPEVARIARKGTLPRPLVETIAGHKQWLAAPEVQRALLGNPRTSAAIATKVLMVMSRADLVLVPQQTSYPQTVRMQARKMLGK